MRPHHDNGIRDVDTDRHIGALSDKEVNSHVYGTGTISVSVGDNMDYHLIKPNIEKGEDYRISQATCLKISKLD